MLRRFRSAKVMSANFLSVATRARQRLVQRRTVTQVFNAQVLDQREIFLPARIVAQLCISSMRVRPPSSVGTLFSMPVQNMKALMVHSPGLFIFGAVGDSLARPGRNAAPVTLVNQNARWHQFSSENDFCAILISVFCY